MYIFKAAVLGAGAMGAEIAQVISFSGLPVILKDVDQAMLDKGLARIRKIYQGRVEKGKMSSGEMDGKMSLVTPALNGGWDGAHLATTFAPGSPIDLSVYDIASGNGLIRWTVAVPMGAHAVELPDIRALGLSYGALPQGPITIGVYGARVDGFNYSTLLYRSLRPAGMSAYSLDSFSAHL